MDKLIIMLIMLLLSSLIIYQGLEINNLETTVQQCKAKEFEHTQQIEQLFRIQDQDRALKVEAWK